MFTPPEDLPSFWNIRGLGTAMFKILNRTLDLVGNAAFFALFIAVFLQVFFRYVIPFPLVWTEELARYLCVWITFLGAAIGFREKGHIVVEILLNRLSPRSRLVHGIIINIVTALFLLSAFIGSLEMMQRTHGILAITMPFIRNSYVYLALPVGIILSWIYLGRHIIQDLMSLGKKAPK